MAKSKGWRHEPARHALASKGVKTGHLTQKKTCASKAAATALKPKGKCPICGQ